MSWSHLRWDSNTHRRWDQQYTRNLEQTSMITFLEGILDEKNPTRVVMNIGGVGYEVFISLTSFDRMPRESESLRLLIYHHVREDAQTLFGFTSNDERALFIRMLAVSGIGPKLAMGVLSGITPRELKSAVINSDIKRLSSISGVGKKTAERLVVELRDTLSKGEVLEATAGEEPGKPGDQRSRDAILALISLGYKQVDAQKMIEQVVKKVSAKDSVEDMVRRALTK